jgi:hypothetical protein
MTGRRGRTRELTESERMMDNDAGYRTGVVNDR